MPRPKGSTKIPTLRHHKASGRAIVTIAGKDVYCGKWGTTEAKRRYEVAVAEFMAIGRSIPVESPRRPVIVTELIVSYWAFLTKRSKVARVKVWGKDRPERSPKCYATHKTALSVLRRFYGGTPIGEFGPLKLRVLLEHMTRCRSTQAGRTDRLWSRRYCNRCIKIVKSMFFWAVHNELAPAPMVEAMRRMPLLKPGELEGVRETSAVTAAADNDVLAVVACAPPQLAAMIRVQWLTGMRSSEMLTLRPRDIDRSQRAPNGVSVWRYRPQYNKTDRHGTERLVPLGPQCQAALAPYLNFAPSPDSYIFTPARGFREGMSWKRKFHDARAKARQRRYVPTARKVCDRYDAGGYSRAVQTAAESADALVRECGGTFTRWHPHQLRHSAATRIRRECDLDTARAALSHTGKEMTENYAELDFAKAMGAMAKLG